MFLIESKFLYYYLLYSICNYSLFWWKVFLGFRKEKVEGGRGSFTQSLVLTLAQTLSF